MTRFYPQYPMSAEGTEAFIRAFSMPGGFPSHVSTFPIYGITGKLWLLQRSR